MSRPVDRTAGIESKVLRRRRLRSEDDVLLEAVAGIDDADVGAEVGEAIRVEDDVWGDELADGVFGDGDHEALAGGGVEIGNAEDVRLEAGEAVGGEEVGGWGLVDVGRDNYLVLALLRHAVTVDDLNFLAALGPVAVLIDEVHARG